MSMRLYTAALAWVVAIGGAASAQDEKSVRAAELDAVVAVAQLNLERVNLPAAVDELVALKIIPDSEVEIAERNADELQGLYAELPKRGAKRLFIEFRLSDIAAEGTTWRIETESPESASDVRDWLKGMLAGAQLPGDLAVVLPTELTTVDRFVVGTRNAKRLQEVAGAATAPAAEQKAVYEELLAADSGLVVFGDADSRRVVRELFPQMPAPFLEIDGKLLADGVKWASINLKLPPKPVVAFNLETSDEATGDVVALAYEKARTVLSGFLTAQSLTGEEQQRNIAIAMLPVASQLALKREGTRLSLSFGDDEAEIAFVRNLLPAVTQDAREAAYRSARMNKLKHITLGLLNYESAKRQLPSQGSFSSEGKPLLSWRVMILPYLELEEGEELYKQFKLDEPWDSEHNRKLLSQMPAVYADPDAAVRRAAGEGKTTYLSTAGKGLFFEGSEARTFKSITDGTSTTVWLVEVAPKRAVEWTKPEDWEVDLANPLSGVAREDRDWFTAGFVDGHVQILSTKNDPAVLRGLLTPAGGEVVDQAAVK